MRRRIMGMEVELGAIREKRNGSWVPAYTKTGPLSRALSGKRSDIFYYGHRLWLPNGGCAYEDQGHLEYATPECLSARDLVVASRGCEQWVEKNFACASGRYGRIVFVKDNTNSRDGVVFGCHENYLYDEKENACLQNEHALDVLYTFLATRIIFTGAGLLTARRNIASARGENTQRGTFVLSYRMMYFPGTGHFLKSRSNQPLAYAPKKRYHRLHVVCGDPNMSELAEFLKFGTMHLLLRLFEDGEDTYGKLPTISSIEPETLWRINRDLDISAASHVMQRSKPRRMSALDIQEAYLEAIAAHFPRDNDPDDVRQETEEILERWAHVLSGLRRNPRTLVRDLDWVHKMVLEERWLQDHGVDSFEHLQRLFYENPPRAQDLLDQLKGLEQRFHELSPRGLWRMQEQVGRVTRLSTDDEVTQARDFPPGHENPDHRCRSWARGMVVRRSQEGALNRIVDINGWYWDEMTFTAADGTRFYVDIMDPFRWKIPQALKTVLRR